MRSDGRLLGKAYRYGAGWGWGLGWRKRVAVGDWGMVVSTMFKGRQEREETYGKKLQAEAGRWATRVKISEIRRCCTLVS